MYNNLANEMFDIMFLYFKMLQKITKTFYNKNGKKNKCELTMQQFQILSVIDESNSDCIIKDMADKAFLSKSALSLLISKLETQGLVKKNILENSIDKRKVDISLTDTGKEELESKRYEMLMYIADTFISHLEQEDLEFLETFLPRIKKMLKEHNNIGGEDEKNKRTS